MGMDAYQNRRSPKDGIEDFPTPPWATRAFLHHVIGAAQPDGATVWEPAANRGYMARPLGEVFSNVIASDVQDYGMGYPVIDFLTGPRPSDFGMEVDWIITNPPFNVALDFALRALEPGMSRHGVALFVRSAWLEGVDRYEKLFSVNPPTMVVQYVGRVPIVRGRVDKKAATTTPYCWVVWDHRIDTGDPIMRWIPHCRKEMEKENDYDVSGTDQGPEKVSGDVGYETKRKVPDIRILLNEMDLHYWKSLGMEPMDPDLEPLTALADQLDALLFCQLVAPDVWEREDWQDHTEVVLQMATVLGVFDIVQAIIRGEH